MNPFKFGQVVGARDFCPRTDLVKQLNGFIESGQNVYLQGERRIGKTSLIHETVRKLKRYRLLYVDLLEIKTVGDLCRRVLAAMMTAERQRGFLETVLQAVSPLRPAVTVDPLTGQPAVTLDSGVQLQPDSIEGLFDLVKAMRKRKELVVVFDEFQDILNLRQSAETLAVLRSKIQFHTTIPYLFAGSIRNQMHEIFTDSESPFFKSAASLAVGPLPERAFLRFLTRKFSGADRTVDPDVLSRVLEITYSIPGDTQQLCGALWEVTAKGKTVRVKDIPAALELIYTREIKGYEAVLVQLTGHQLKCLRGLARIGGKAPFSAGFLRETGIALPASVKQALNRLQRLKIVYRQDGEFRFVNPFFASWLLWRHI